MDSKVEIRASSSKDQSQVVVLWKCVFSDDPLWNNPLSMIQWKLSVQPELFLVAYIDNQVVGTIMAGFIGSIVLTPHPNPLPQVERKCKIALQADWKF